jgi:putative transposase
MKKKIQKQRALAVQRYLAGEIFSAPPETQYEYVVATVDVKEQKLKLFLDRIRVEEYKYKLR